MAILKTVILNYKTPDMTIRAAEAALREMERIEGGIVIVDNASGDGSFERLCAAVEAQGWTEGGRVQVVQSGRNGGFGAGNNFGICTDLPGGMRPDYVYILNSDAWPEPGAIGRLIAHLDATPVCGMAGSFIKGPDGHPHVTAFRFPSILGEFEGAARTGLFTRLLRRWVIPLPIPEQTARVDWSAGASMMLRQDMLDAIGLFDETFFLYYEETDLCLRAARAGWECHYLPESVAIHIGSVSTGMRKWQRIPGYWLDSRLYYYMKNHGPAYTVAATIAQLSGGAIWQLRRLTTGRADTGPRWFLSDLAAHSLGALLRGRPAPSHLVMARPMIEDRK